MCLKFTCVDCKVLVRQYCHNYIDYASHCDYISNVDGAKRKRFETCSTLYQVIKRLERLVWVEPWRAGREKEAWETNEPEKDFYNSDFECDGWEEENSSDGVDSDDGGWWTAELAGEAGGEMAVMGLCEGMDGASQEEGTTEEGKKE